MDSSSSLPSPAVNPSPPPELWGLTLRNTQVISYTLLGMLGLFILAMLLLGLWLSKHTFCGHRKRRGRTTAGLWVNTCVIPLTAGPWESPPGPADSTTGRDALNSKTKNDLAYNKCRSSLLLRPDSPCEAARVAEMALGAPSPQQAVIAQCRLCQYENSRLAKARCPGNRVTSAGEAEGACGSHMTAGRSLVAPSVDAAQPSPAASARVGRERASTSSGDPSECPWIHLSLPEHDMGHTRLERAPLVQGAPSTCEGFMLLKVITI